MLFFLKQFCAKDFYTDCIRSSGLFMTDVCGTSHLCTIVTSQCQHSKCIHLLLLWRPYKHCCVADLYLYCLGNKGTCTKLGQKSLCSCALSAALNDCFSPDNMVTCTKLGQKRLCSCAVSAALNDCFSPGNKVTCTKLGQKRLCSCAVSAALNDCVWTW